MQAGRTVIFHETTLRDGEQTPGVSFHRHEKLAMAKAIAELLPGCVLDAGYPAISDDEFRAVQLIAEEVSGVQVFCVARAIPRDLDQAWRAIERARAPRLCVIAPVSDLLLHHKMSGMSREQCLRLAVNAVHHVRAASAGRAAIDFAMEDTTRGDPAFVAEIAAAVSEAGAEILFVCDSVGVAVPVEMARWIERVRSAAPAAVVAAHCHDDFGLALANTLAAVEAGASVVSSSINGLGERAGNAATEELIAALTLRRDHYRSSIEADPTQIPYVSRLVAECSGIVPHAVKAIVGRVAVGVRETGPQVDGILKDPRTYEGVPPEFLGRTPLPEGLEIIIGKKSSRGSVRARLRQLEASPTEEEALNVFFQVKARSAVQKVITDEDLLKMLHALRKQHPTAAA